ncbi:MAG: MoxR family ATPase [Deltaproteobacteria bacterium]|nr:MoxR family ATPase [Deltaproteobacteria bacterium]
MCHNRAFPVDPSLRHILDDIRQHLNAVVRGKPEVIDLLIVGVMGAGHVLIEDVPGVGKTTLAKALARIFDVQFSRVQFTPDLLPADIVGTEVLKPADGSFVFHAGPVFTSVLLADEINRASPRTQSALLEAMNEQQVTVEGVSRPLPAPFFVIATQNPVDFQGTYPLPEAQLDRFLLRVKLGYPDPDDELKILVDRKLTDPLLALEPLATGSHILELQDAARHVELKESVARYVLALCGATREHRDLELGVSTRGALALYRAAQAHALLADRDFVTPDDVQAMAVPVLAHRVMLAQEARYGGTAADGIIAAIVDRVAVPT